MHCVVVTVWPEPFEHDTREANPMIQYTKDLFTRALPALTDPVLADVLAAQADAVQLALTAARKEAAELRADPALTPQGVALALPAVTQRAAARLVATKATITQLEKGVEISGAILSTEMRHRLPPNVNLEDARWREREARDRLVGMDPLVREGMYLDACQRCDVSAIRAFEQTPPMFPMFTDPDVLPRGAEIFARNRYPDEWQVREQQILALSLMQTNLAGAVAQLATITGSNGEPDAIADAAGMSGKDN
jgi:hypothetical protein